MKTVDHASQIAVIWNEILGIKDADPTVSFIDLGGTSLLANKLTARIQELIGVIVPVIMVFEHPTLEKFTEYFQSIKNSETAPRPNDSSTSTVAVNSPYRDEDIAIIGMACRFPGAENLDEFWDNLIHNRESIRKLDLSEIAADVSDEMKRDPQYVPVAGLISDPYKMDAAFFDISPKEATLIDPQQRVILETAWAALENAGYAPGTFDGNAAVFAGTEDNSYYRTEIVPFPKEEESSGRFMVMTGNEKDYVAMRIAHKLGLKGAAISVHTACSTSLVAIIMACKALRSGDCSLALAGGASVHFPTPEGYYYQEGGVFSPDGHCRPFDANAKGTVFTDGSGIVVLKRLRDALRDCDTIAAVIKGGAINNDGSNRASFSSPSITGQVDCIKAAFADANVAPISVQYVEAHGTATRVGDPIEVEALRQAFGTEGIKKQFCGIGSVKSNIGHTTAAAGVAGVIKSVLALQHEIIPATLHYTSPNPGLNIESSPFFVTGINTPWKRGIDGVRRTAGISSFGIGGTNSHLILQEAPLSSPCPEDEEIPFEIYPVAAKTDTARDQLIESFAQTTQLPRDVAFTLQHGRAPFRIRGARIVFNKGRFPISDDPPPDLVVRHHQKSLLNPLLVFMFPGQGSQYIGMGRGLYNHFPVFREHFDLCCAQLDQELNLDFKSFIFDPKNSDSLENTRFTQPALFAVEVSLGRLLMSWGIRPDRMIGHSVGEFAAAHLADVFSLADGIKLICARGRLMSDLPKGKMLSVRAPLDTVKALLSQREAPESVIDIASINSPVHCVLSGESAAIDTLQRTLESQGITCRALHTSHAFHSSMMDPVVVPFLEIAQQVRYSPPTIPILSTTTCTPLTPELAQSPRYWAEHLRATVQFSPALQSVIAEGGNVFIEVGPRTTLATLAVQHLHGFDASAISTLTDSADELAELGAFASAIAKLWSTGVAVPWSTIWPHGRRVPLPTYPFERKEFRFSEGLSIRQPHNRQVHMNAVVSHSSSTGEKDQIQVYRERSLIDEIAAIIASHSGVSTTNYDLSFFEMGLDSLVLIQVGVEVSKRFGVSVLLSELMGPLSTTRLLAQRIERDASPQKLAQFKNSRPLPTDHNHASHDILAHYSSPSICSAADGALLQTISDQLVQMKQVLELQIAYIAATRGSNLDIKSPHMSTSNPSVTPAPEISRVTTAEVITVPSSVAQREIFSASMFESDASLGYNQPMSIFFKGNLDEQKLSRSLVSLLARHEALRGYFSTDGLSFLIPPATNSIALPRHDLSRLPEENRKHAYNELIRRDIETTFDLTKGPLFRAMLIIESDTEAVLAFNCHHSVVDGWSLKTILSDLPKLYSDDPTLEIASSYAEYLLNTTKFEEEQGPSSLNYWSDVYRNGTPALDLPIDFPRPLHRTYRSKREDFEIDRGVYESFKSLASRIGASQFMTLLSVFTLYLSKITGQKEVPIGVPVAGQITCGKAKLLGHDSRVLPLLLTLEDGDTFRSYTEKVRDHFFPAYENHYISLPLLFKRLNISVDAARINFMPVMFNFDPGFKAEDFVFRGLDSHFFFNPRACETFEISVNAVIEGDKLILECAYNADLFDAEMMHARMQQLEHLMRSVSSSLDTPVREIPILPAHQAEQIDSTLNATGMQYEREVCVDHVIEKISREHPDRIAVEYGSTCLTYHHLWRDSTKVGNAVITTCAAREGRVNTSRLVGVMLDRSEKLVPTLLGIWRAGCAFVPLDPAYPADRLQYMIDHSGLNLIVSQSELLDKVNLSGCQVLDVDIILGGNEVDAGQLLPPPFERKAHDPAYVIYTSGSTGKPKGVKVPHCALHNFLITMGTQRPGISMDDRVLAITTLSFDIAELELWLPLTFGARTIIVDRAIAIDGQELIKVIEEKEISLMQVTPATWRLLLFAGWRGRKELVALCGGEALPRELAEQLLPKVKRLWNVYGPTETTVWSTIDEVTGGPITIGTPVGNTQLYVLDENRVRMPQGSVGELWIGGEGVTLGYLHAPDLTEQRFVPNPFSGIGQMYKTGDLVRMRRDGRIEYVGRNDFQVKVRGYRIELGEVQHTLSKQSGIGECSVIVRERTPGDAHLVAYYTKKSTHMGVLPIDALKRGMRGSIPEYMIPTYFVELAALPLTQNGKVDQKQLPDPFKVHQYSASTPVESRSNPTEDTESSSGIARLLTEHPLVQEAVLIHSPSATRPVLYYVPRSKGEELTVITLRKHLAGRVAESAIPHKIIRCERLPETTNKRSSIEPEIAPEFLSKAEKYLTDLWKEFLGVPHIKPTDNFFDLGGHSLLTVQMIERVYKEVGVRLSPKMVLLNTVEVLSKQLPNTPL